MIRSMTGFGAAEGRVGSARVTVELRTVNHRFFNPSIKLPSEFARWERELRELLRRAIARGHVTLVARVTREATAALAIDDDKFGAYVRLLRELQGRHSLGDTVDVATVLRLPGVVAGDGPEQVEGTLDELADVVQQALRAVTGMREAEGQRLDAVLRERLGAIEEAVDRIAARAPARLEIERERLRRSVGEMCVGIQVDEMRLAQEIAILADRLDVSEEIDRFRSHVTAFHAALRSGDGEPVGKRLGFLLQEMLREANTTGSKARDAVMLHEVVGVKEELERIAEQVENLE